MTVQLDILGTGTSQGVPVMGCSCAVCTSTDPRDKRLRTSALFTVNDQRFLIDCGPDLRQQCLRAGIADINAILLTHEHNDHIIGIDDVRPINFRFKRDMPIYGLARVLEDLKDRFKYVFRAQHYPGTPVLTLCTLTTVAFHIGDVPVQPIGVLHGQLPILGYRIGNIAYITDCKTLPDSEFEKLEGIEYLVLNALHWEEHHAHLTVPQAVALVQKIRPRRAYLTHLSHQAGTHAALNAYLPEGIEIAYDGLQLTTTT